MKVGAIPTAWTMKILESTDYSAWRHEFTCKKCESKLEAEPSDVIVMYQPAWSDQRDFYQQPEAYFYKLECPVCKELYSLDPSYLPKRMIVDLKKRAK